MKRIPTGEPTLDADAAREWLRRCLLILNPATDPPAAPGHPCHVAQGDVVALWDRLKKKGAPPAELIAQARELLAERGLLERVDRFAGAALKEVSRAKS